MDWGVEGDLFGDEGCLGVEYWPLVSDVPFLSTSVLWVLDEFEMGLLGCSLLTVLYSVMFFFSSLCSVCLWRLKKVLASAEEK